LELVDFALKRDIPVNLEALPAPHAHWESAEDLWSDLLEAEKSNSQALYTLANAAHECMDHAVTTFLQPFHTEQVNAIADMKTILAKVREEAKTPGLIRQLDSELGSSAGGGIK
jgi:ferritin